jgi:hypothetical protein
MMPCRLAYWPVTIEARFGEQIGVVWKAQAHTSNGRGWILGHLPDYAGADRYRDVPHAVADGRLVSAPGSAPGTFAIAFLEVLYPEQKEQIAQKRTIFAGEYGAESARGGTA